MAQQEEVPAVPPREGTDERSDLDQARLARAIMHKQLALSLRVFALFFVLIFGIPLFNWLLPGAANAPVGGFTLTNVHRDYKKGTADNAPTTSISILDSAANPDYVTSTTAAWNMSTTTTEGYTKTVKIDDMPGFETFENEGKHGTLWLMVAKRYILQIETQNQESKELQDWLKRIDLKKLATVK